MLPIHTLPLQKLSELSPAGILELETLVEQATSSGGWKGEPPRFAVELGTLHHCDPGHALVYQVLLRMCRKRYRNWIETTLPDEPYIVLTLAEIPDRDDCEAMSRQQLLAWVGSLEDRYPAGSDCRAEEGGYLEDYLGKEVDVNTIVCTLA